MASLKSKARGLTLTLGLGLAAGLYLIPAAPATAASCYPGQRECHGGSRVQCTCYNNGYGTVCRWRRIGSCGYYHTPPSEPPSEFMQMSMWKDRPALRAAKVAGLAQ